MLLAWLLLTDLLLLLLAELLLLVGLLSLLLGPLVLLGVLLPFAAFLFATQASLMYFCNPCIRTLAWRFLP